MLTVKKWEYLAALGYFEIVAAENGGKQKSGISITHGGPLWPTAYKIMQNGVGLGLNNLSISFSCFVFCLNVMPVSFVVVHLLLLSGLNAISVVPNNVNVLECIPDISNRQSYSRG